MAIKRTKYCANKTCKKPIKYGSYCSLNCSLVKPKQKKATKIKPVSDKRKKELKTYSEQRKLFLVNKICPITQETATEIHHIKGRDNKWLNDINYWLAVSRNGHIWIHNNPIEAEEKGYLIKRST